jgi:hypothetical protein
VLGGPAHLTALLDELVGRGLTYGAKLGSGLALEHITADAANPFLHNYIPPVWNFGVNIAAQRRISKGRIPCPAIFVKQKTDGKRRKPGCTERKSTV